MVRFSAFTIGLVLLLSIWAASAKAGAALTNGAAAPDVAGENWLNSKPLSMGELKGRVVLVEFWTYG
ncbi:MAG TPA: hypothetical protein VK200_13880 [Candidatus Limnocylindrales bacterium]|nr:hypothetical protein [Candidatus Limnocylindrales bacterium]